MEQEQTSPEHLANNSDPYLNGQSDAEKLMRRHLQTPGDVITEDELKNLKITGAEDTGAGNTMEDVDDTDAEVTEEHTPKTPWDIID